MTKQLQPAGTPGRRASALWQYQGEIRRLREEGWTTVQIKSALGEVGVEVSERWLREWCARHLGPIRPRRPAGQTGAVPAGIPPSERAGSPAPLASEGASMEELLAGAGARASRPASKKPKSTGSDPVADLLKKLK